MKDPNRSFLGLRRECTACHQEPHQNQLGTDCRGCHTFQGWKPAAKFDHSRAPFQLTGLHQKVACGKCHPKSESTGSGEVSGGNAATEGRPGPKAVLFKGLAFNNGCQSCHADRHHGAFQAVKVNGRCEGCHNTGGWKENHPGTGFNHSLAIFRLVGKHADLACGKCHKESDFARPIAHDLCRNCHQDLHKGQFAARAEGSDCSACHNPAGFKPALFDREAHRRGPFPLMGKHSTLDCAKCHKPEGRDTRFKTGKLLCPACHAEPHGGEFAAEPYSNRCDKCHSPAGFEATTFSLERHAETRFPLTGRHAAVPCGKCHKALGPPGSGASPESAKAAPDARRRYHFASRACDACHADPHGISTPADLPCATCHVTLAWKEPLPFDHSRTRFKLDGRHQDAEHPIACTRCHQSSATAAGGDGGSAPVYTRSSTECSRCHVEKDAHGSQFGSPDERRKDCSLCHITAGWNAGGFDHDRTRFALNNAHRKAACAKCHKEVREENGRSIREYRNTPVECLKCH